MEVSGAALRSGITAHLESRHSRPYLSAEIATGNRVYILAAGQLSAGCPSPRTTALSALDIAPPLWRPPMIAIILPGMLNASRYALGMLVISLTLGASASFATAQDKLPELYPYEKVRRGQTGYGMTTFKGTTPERFTFEIIGVKKNFLPKMDIILVKSDDPKLAVRGFWRGMSGSPLYLDGKLLCAFSYGYRFNKVAIGGCTPLRYMMEEGFMKQRRSPNELRGRLKVAGQGAHQRSGKNRAANLRTVRTGRRTTVASINDWLRIAPQRTVDSAMRALADPNKTWLERLPLPRVGPRQVASRDPEDTGMVASAIPMAMSGFSGSAFDRAKELLEHFPVDPMRAGGAGDPNGGPTAFQMGGSIAVQILRGDMSAAATGTVSYIDRNRVLGFGHPLFQSGEQYAPVATAEVHTVIPSAMSPFVVASPMREIGSLIQDRQSTIMADTNQKARMVPVDMWIEWTSERGSTEKREFHVEVVDDRFMTAPFTGIAAMNAMSLYLPDRDPAVTYVESTVHVRGYKPLSFIDYLYDDTGPGSGVSSARGLRAMMVVLNNPFAPLEVERVELRAKIRFGINHGRIQNIRLPSSELKPGARTYVSVEMTTYDGQNIVEKVPFDVPADMAGSIVRMEVAAGDDTTLDIAAPKNVDDLMRALRKLLPGNVVAVTLYSANEGVAVDGKLVRDLPPSALDRLRPRHATHRADLYRPLARSTYPTKRVLTGKKTRLVQIAPK